MCLMKNRGNAEMERMYDKIYVKFESCVMKPTVNVLTMNHWRQCAVFLSANKVTHQKSLPHCHHANTTKKAIETGKPHFIAGLSSVYPLFPMEQ